jgi:hypothetical protein
LARLLVALLPARTGQFKPDKNGRVSPLGRLMEFLGVKHLWELSYMIPKPNFTGPRSPSWVQVYRELVEWAVLFALLRDYSFGTDTIIRVLGVLRKAGEKVVFVASHRRLPHVGSPIAFPSMELLQELVGQNLKSADGKTPAAKLGHYALGEFIYGGDSKSLDRLEWMQVKSPEVVVRFRIEDLVSRRSFIFARAGFGKSNLNKLLFSQLYGEKEVPTVTKAGGRKVPVGTIIFDPDGEYFWPDDKGRPGLCDVPGLENKLVLFTPRKNPSAFYSSFIAGGIKLDVRRLRPGDVIAIALGPDRQDQQNVRKLRGLVAEPSLGS